jgi:hypothetical protein
VGAPDKAHGVPLPNSQHILIFAVDIVFKAEMIAGRLVSGLTPGVPAQPPER